MIDKIKRTIKELSDTVQEQATTFGASARERSFEMIEEWLRIFPKLEMYKLEITSFSLGVAISPSLEVELVGKHEDFSQERLQEILTENKGSTGVTLVFNTIKTAYSLHRKTYAALNDPLIVKIKVKISPEVQVFIGEPLIQ